MASFHLRRNIRKYQDLLTLSNSLAGLFVLLSPSCVAPVFDPEADMFLFEVCYSKKKKN